MAPTDEIAVFYDAHPYPPPKADLKSALRDWDERSRRIEHFRHWPTLPVREKMSILVAGCGTSQAARWAARYPTAQVLGIDVSPSSLKATGELARECGLNNLELNEMAIEDLDGEDQTFDLVVCTGVLHHLADPVAGLRALRDVTSDDGALHLMVYASYGRLGLSMIRNLTKILDLTPEPESISRLMEIVREIPVGHPMSHALRSSPDFGDRDALADALLNPRETSYTVPELFDYLLAGGVEFGRWTRQAPYRPQCGVMRELPLNTRLTVLDDVDQYTAMELFRGTMMRHNLIGYRNDAAIPDLSWDDNSWGSFVPMVPSDVVVVRERVPPGTAAAVINQTHVDRDLVCFLNEAELAVFEAIDGEATFIDIPDATMALAERLWMHDLIVVDAS